MEELETTSFAGMSFPGRPNITKSPPSRRRLAVVNAKRDMNGGEYGGRVVDENMVVLRMRIREMKMSETSHDELPSGWMEWEKKYYVQHYKEDVSEGVGLLQFHLMNTRPCLALGVGAIVALSLPFSGFVVVLRAVEVAKLVLSGLHLG